MLPARINPKQNGKQTVKRVATIVTAVAVFAIGAFSGNDARAQSLSADEKKLLVAEAIESIGWKRIALGSARYCREAADFSDGKVADYSINGVYLLTFIDLKLTAKTDFVFNEEVSKTCATPIASFKAGTSKDFSYRICFRKFSQGWRPWCFQTAESSACPC